jgi:murein DD-endopeptidase MepM/ murein hydrolase activator NlpD
MARRLFEGADLPAPTKERPAGFAGRAVLAVTLAVILAAPAVVGGQARAQSTSDRLQALRAKIAAAQAQEAELSSEIGSLEGRIRTLESEVGDVSARLEPLERDLALHQEKLARITKLFRLQTERLNFLKRQYAIALDGLNRRLIEIYESDQATTVDILLSARDLGAVIEQLDYMRDLTSQDLKISTEVNHAKVQVRDAREKTKKTRQQVATVTRTIAVRTAQVRAVRERLLVSKRGLSAARGHKRAKLASVEESKREYLNEVAGIEAASSQVTAQIQATGSTSYDSTPSASGLIWPVNGPVISPFGMRWGRMHTGIDIAVPYGTPIHASASGAVIFAGWMGGYGNFVIVDHGGGLATAYAHQSSIAVGGGSVSQGQVIGYVGCTGHCFGPHLHFEVRVNGTPVDPLGYL